MAGRKGKAKVENEEPQAEHACFCMGMGPTVTEAVKVGSEKTREHFRNARVEFLKGLRNLIDERIEALNKEEASQKGAKIAVD